MKRNIQLFIILLLAVVLLSACDDIGFLPTTPDIPITEDVSVTLLTPEEIELIKTWGFGGDYVVRWPDGYVDVYDGTDYPETQKVLNQWNSIIGGKVVFRLSRNPDSPVRIIFDESLQAIDLCSNAEYKIENHSFTEWVIRTKRACFDDAKQLYLYNFNGVTGFNVWKEVDPTPFEHWTKFYEIPKEIKKMVRALHKAPQGHYLGKKPEIKFEPINCSVYKCGPNEGCESTNLFDGFNKIEFNGSKVTLKALENGVLPEDIKIVLEGIRFNIVKDYAFTGTTCNKDCEFVKGDWNEDASTIAEVSYKEGIIEGGTKYESINGYTIDVDFNKSEIYIKLAGYIGNAFNAVPWDKVELKIFDPKSGKIGGYTFTKGIFPRVYSHFGQCVWWAIKQKYENGGKIITPPFYPPPGGIMITDKYTPAEHDILVANDAETEHYAFIKNIIKVKNVELVRISQFNWPVQQRLSEQILYFDNRPNVSKRWSNPKYPGGNYIFQFNYYIK